MPKPQPGADQWASANRGDTPGARPADTIERVIERRVPAVSPAPPIRSRAPAVPALSPAPPSPTLVPGSLAYVFAANRALSGSALKVLLAVLEAGNGAVLLRNDFKRLTGLSGDHAVLNAVQECVDGEWLTRQYQCRWCQALLPPTYDSIRLIACAGCGRTMTPQAVFCLAVPEEGVPKEHTIGVSKEHTPVSLEHTGMPQQHTGVFNEQTRVPIQQGGMLDQHTEGMSIEHTTPLANLNGEGMLNQHTGMPQEHTSCPADERQDTSTALTTKINGVLKKHTGMPLQHTKNVLDEHTGVSKKPTSRARADTESVSRISESDSRIPPTSGISETGRVVYASEGWQKITEQLAKDSARRIGDGKSSVGFHIKCWAHARKLDWEKGGRRFEDGLLTIAQELEGKHKGSGGKSQGALWTKMVRRYFEEKGHPLLTEAEQGEWKELHGTYQPPQIGGS